MGGRTADRDDLVQDVFLVVFRRLPDFDGKNLAGWLYQITRRRVRDFRRSAWLRRLFFGSTTLTEVRAGHGFDPSETLETAQKRDILERLLGTLNEPERVALVLFEIEDYSGEEIAELQGVPTNTVWARIRRARIKMCNALEKFEASPAPDRAAPKVRQSSAPPAKTTHSLPPTPASRGQFADSKI